MESGRVPSTPPTLKKPSVERLMAFFFFPSVAALKGDFFRPELLKLFGVNKRQLTIHAASKPVTAPRKPSRVNTLPQSEHAGRRQEVEHPSFAATPPPKKVKARMSSALTRTHREHSCVNPSRAGMS